MPIYGWQFNAIDPHELQLGLVRILFFGWLAGTTRWSKTIQLADVHMRCPELWQPSGFIPALAGPAVASALTRHARELTLLWQVASVLAVAGVLFPIGNIVCIVLFTILVGYTQQFGKTSRSFNIVPFAGVYLSCAPADALALLPLGNVVSPALGHSWPVQLGRLTLATIWFVAGFAKVRHSGIRWAWSDNLQLLIRLHLMDYTFMRPAAPRLSRLVVSHDLVCRLCAAGVILVELSYPLALCSTVLAICIVPLSILSLWSFHLLLGPAFVPLAVSTVLFWFPFDWAARSCGAIPACAAFVSAVLIVSRLPLWLARRSIRPVRSMAGSPMKAPAASL